MPFSSELVVPSETASIPLAREWLLAFAKDAGIEFPKRAVFACVTALIEAVGNAIFHAHGERSHLPVEVRAVTDGRTVEMSVIDSGQGFSGRTPSEPDEMSESGRGLLMITKLVTTVESRIDDGRHILRMVYSL